MIYVAKALRYCLRISHDKPAFDGRVFNLKILVIEDNVEISEALSFFCGAKKDIKCQVVNTRSERKNKIQ